METTETTSPSIDGSGISYGFIPLDGIEAFGPNATITERWYRLHTHAKSMCELMVAFNSALEPGYAPQGLGTAVHAQLARLEKLVAAARISITPAVAATDDWKRDGSKCPSDSFAGATGSSRGKARADMETGKNLANAPGTQQSFLNGDLSPEQAATIADAVKANPAAEQELLDCAKRKSLKELKTEALRRKSEVEDMDERERRLHRQRYVRQWTDQEGAWNLRARGPIPTGADFQSVLERLIDQQFKKARKSGVRGTRDNYGYDALMDLAAQHGTGHGPATTGAAPAAATGTAADPNGRRSKAQAPAGNIRGPEDRSDNNDDGGAGDDSGVTRPKPTPPAGPTTGGATAGAGPKPRPHDARTNANASGSAPPKPRPGSEPSHESGAGRHQIGRPDEPTSPPHDTPSGGTSDRKRTAQAAELAKGPMGGSDDASDDLGSEDRAADPIDVGQPGLPFDVPEPAGVDAAQWLCRLGSADVEVADAEASTADPTAERSSQRTRPPVSQQQIYCIDWNALVRGHARTGERCELRGFGPTSVSTIRWLLASSAAKLVVTDAAGRAVTVAHLGTGPINLRLIPGLTVRSTNTRAAAPQHEPIGEAKLVIIGISGDDLRGNAGVDPCLPPASMIDIPGFGEVPGRSALTVLGSEVMARLLTRGQAVRELRYTGRAPNAAQRIALAWADLTCKVESCPNERIEIDHRDPWAADRVTELDNLDPLCSHHHDLKTNAGWQFVAPDSTRFVPPDDPDHPLGTHARRSARNAS